MDEDEDEAGAEAEDVVQMMDDDYMRHAVCLPSLCVCVCVCVLGETTISVLKFQHVKQ